MARKTQKNFVLGSLIVATFAVLVVITAIWLGFGTFTNSQGEIIKPTMGYKLIITFGGLIIIFINYLLFNHQKKLDKKKILNTGRGLNN